MTKLDNKNLIIGALVIIVVIIFLGSFGFGGYGMMRGYNPEFMIFGWIFNILIFILIILGIFWLIKHVDINGRRKK
jgi:hypothetical protein